MTLFWKLFTSLALVLTIAVALLLVTPRTLTLPLTPTETAEIVVGYALLLAGTAVTLRRGLRPLAELRRAIEERTGVAEPDRVPVRRGDEVGLVAAAYNDLLDRLARERRRGSGMALAAQESERRRVARELHDEVGQSLTVVLLRLKHLAGLTPAALLGEVEETQELARAALAEVRAIAARLRPGALDDLGLSAALISLATGATANSGLLVRRDIQAIEGTTPEQDLAIYRIAQEALTNVLRHAGAKSVAVVLRQEDGGITLTVTDDGVGLTGAAGGGLTGMQERAILVGGALDITAPAGGGTKVRFHVPLNEPAAVDRARSAQ